MQPHSLKVFLLVVFVQTAVRLLRALLLLRPDGLPFLLGGPFQSLRETRLPLGTLVQAHEVLVVLLNLLLLLPDARVVLRSRKLTL